MTTRSSTYKRSIHRRPDGTLPPLAGGATDAPPATDQLADIRRQIEPARLDGQAKWAAYEKKRKQVIGDGKATDAAEIKELEASYDAYTQAAELHASLRKSERLLSPDDDQPSFDDLGGSMSFEQGGRGPGQHDGVNKQTLTELTKTPGALLSSMLGRRKRDVSTLPEHIRYAQSTPITTDNVDTVTESAAVIDLLSPLSVALASGIQVMRMSTTKTRVPRFKDLPNAAWIAELGAFPKNGPGIEMVDVEPSKVGLITEVSTEVFEDLSPLMLSMLQVQILRAIALKFDQGILFGSGTGAEPLGVANTPGIGAVTGIPLTSLAAFAKAIALLIGKNAKPGALVMNPLDVGKLLQVTESASGAGSNVPLWKASVGSASGLRLPYFDTPIWPTPACPVNRGLLFDPATIIAAIRRDADIAIDPYYGFNNGIVGLRTYLRGEPVVGQVDGTVTIEFATS